MRMKAEVINWLLEPENLSIRYRTLTEILCRDENDPEVHQVKALIPSSKPVERIFSKMDPKGFWYFVDKRTQRGKGDGTDYWDYTTTHFNLAFLSELGMDKSDPRIAMAADRYLNLQQSDGDYLDHMSCLYAYNLRTLIRMGYQEDDRVQRTIQLLVSSVRHDGGYLCDMHEGKYKTMLTKSCVRGSIKALMAFSEIPKLWNTTRCMKLVSYFLDRRGIFNTQQPSEPVTKEITTTIFPFTWRGSLLEVLLGLSIMGHGVSPRLQQAWDLLETKKDDDGLYRLDWAPTKALFKPGKRGFPNKWVTFYSYLALKHKASYKQRHLENISSDQNQPEDKG